MAQQEKPKKSKGRKKADYIVIPNPDKAAHEEWDDRRSFGNPPRPWRAICAGPPNGGKSNAILNFIGHARPPFADIIVSSADPEASEWQHFAHGCTVTTDIPDYREFENDGQHRLIILEDLALDRYKGEQAILLDRLLAHGSTHRNLSVVMTCQDFFNIPKCCRIYSNIFNVWKTADLNNNKIIASRVGLTQEEMVKLYNKFCHGPKDYITIDLTPGCPAPVRFKLVKDIVLGDIDK